ncbi:hypothetical protein [Motilibacter deserti]|uniref:Uncharacterized protein n=1 Tax=Motilibacter deserti TaxID=2714956 RepID=A0ABX0GQJ9_9ACTN|nr:hypothetical protein [Motilibacter deserti]NHC12760.1 hypothetical protein [Motilibacter deserti]
MSDEREDLPQRDREGLHGDVHDMGGNIGPASIRPSSERQGSGSDADSTAPQEGYAEPYGVTAGPDDEFQERTGAVFGGDSAPPPVADAPSEYVSIDDADNLGRGGDGDTEARLQQKESGEF